MRETGGSTRKSAENVRGSLYVTDRRAHSPGAKINLWLVRTEDVQGREKRLVSLVKQDPGKARQNS